MGSGGSPHAGGYAADDPPTDLLEHGGDVGGGRDREKVGLEALVGAIQIDAFQKQDMEVQVHIDATAEALDKRDRSRLHLMPVSATCDGLIDVISRDDTADNSMHLRRQVLRRRHPVA